MSGNNEDPPQEEDQADAQVQDEGHDSDSVDLQNLADEIQENEGNGGNDEIRENQVDDQILGALDNQGREIE